MKNKIIRACDMIEIPRKLLHDPELTLAAKGVAGTLVAFNDRDYSATELAKESGTSENELIDALEELRTHGYVHYQNNAYILQEVM